MTIEAALIWIGFALVAGGFICLAGWAASAIVFGVLLIALTSMGLFTR